MNQLTFSQYNKLPVVGAADALYNQQLAAANITRDKLLSLLAPLFLQAENAGRYAACLIHRHYLLQEGERMVANGNSTQPSKDTSDSIVPDCWMATGQAVEYRFATVTDRATLPPPPSQEFFNSFKKITDSYGVDMLGVCYLPEMDQLKDGFVFLETAGSGDREQVISIVSESEIVVDNSNQIYETAWVTTFDPFRELYVATGPINCINHFGPRL